MITVEEALRKLNTIARNRQVVSTSLLSDTAKKKLTDMLDHQQKELEVHLQPEKENGATAKK